METCFECRWVQAVIINTKIPSVILLFHKHTWRCEWAHTRSDHTCVQNFSNLVLDFILLHRRVTIWGHAPSSYVMHDPEHGMEATKWGHWTCQEIHLGDAKYQAPKVLLGIGLYSVKSPLWPRSKPHRRWSIWKAAWETIWAKYLVVSWEPLALWWTCTRKWTSVSLGPNGRSQDRTDATSRDWHCKHLTLACTYWWEMYAPTSSTKGHGLERLKWAFGHSPHKHGRMACAQWCRQHASRRPCPWRCACFLNQWSSTSLGFPWERQWEHFQCFAHTIDNRRRPQSFHWAVQV